MTQTCICGKLIEVIDNVPYNVDNDLEHSCADMQDAISDAIERERAFYANRENEE